MRALKLELLHGGCRARMHEVRPAAHRSLAPCRSAEAQLPKTRKTFSTACSRRCRDGVLLWDLLSLLPPPAHDDCCQLCLGGCGGLAMWGCSRLRWLVALRLSSMIETVFEARCRCVRWWWEAWRRQWLVERQRAVLSI